MQHNRKSQLPGPKGQRRGAYVRWLREESNRENPGRAPGSARKAPESEATGLSMPRPDVVAANASGARRDGDTKSGHAPRSERLARGAERQRAVSRRHSRREVSWKDLANVAGPSKAGKVSGAEWCRQMVVVSKVSGVCALARMGHMCAERQGSESPVWGVFRDAPPTSPAYSPCTRSVRTVGWEGLPARGGPIPLCAGHGPVACRCATRAYPNRTPGQG